MWKKIFISFIIGLLIGSASFWAIFYFVGRGTDVPDADRVTQLEATIQSQESTIGRLESTVREYADIIRRRKELDIERERELSSARETIQLLIESIESDIEGVERLEGLYNEVRKRLLGDEKE